MRTKVMDPSGKAFDPAEITRPHGRLLFYYFLVSCLSFCLFPFTFLPLLVRYKTLHYRFDDSGVSIRWGLLFRREVHLTYRRIQDIHLSKNLIQRWVGLAVVEIQTASGQSGPEIKIEGVLEAESLRDHLYAKMRGAQEEGSPEATKESENGVPNQDDQTLALLVEIRDLLGQMNIREKPKP